MTTKPRVLVTYPNFHRSFVPFLPFYEPLVAILLGSLVKDFAEVKIFDRRYESPRSWQKVLKQFKPDLIAARIHTSGEIFTTRRMLEEAKCIIPEVITIIGGQHPTLLPDDFNQPCFDLICIGPGEETFPEVVKALRDNTPLEQVKGLAIRKGNKFIFTEERALVSGTFRWPVLDRTLAARYRRHFHAGITITTHGCPHRCTFCSLWFTARGTYRLRDIQDVTDDIAQLPQRRVYIADDNTFHDHIHAMKMADALEKRGVKKQYGAYARTDTIVEHPEVFQRWRKIGLYCLVVGFEVVNNAGLDGLNKRTTLENNVKAIEILNQLGIECFAHFIIFPHFKQKEFRELWAFIKKYKIAQPYFVPLTPTPGTILFKEMKEKKQLSIYNYGFFNLEYMVCKTTLPKWRFYFEYVLLWLKSISPLNYLRMRKYMSCKAYLWKIAIVLRAIPPYILNVTQQIIEEKSVTYDDVKDTLPPSLQDGYQFRYLKNDAK
ncbi:MAG: radical SAM protein [Candidatus Omnitrophota bacterium]|nr:B12-binding domain-containing radical SAM protein [Candidatus Omnitrophota bacterium]